MHSHPFSVWSGIGVENRFDNRGFDPHLVCFCHFGYSSHVLMKCSVFYLEKEMNWMTQPCCSSLETSSFVLFNACYPTPRVCLYVSWVFFVRYHCLRVCCFWFCVVLCLLLLLVCLLSVSDLLFVGGGVLPKMTRNNSKPKMTLRKLLKKHCINTPTYKTYLPTHMHPSSTISFIHDPWRI